MNSTIKTVVLLALLVGSVFLITWLGVYSPSESSDQKADQLETGKKPLQFFTSRRVWRPYGGSLQDTIFPGYFEPGANANSATFWFSNPDPELVHLRLKGASCTSCSGGQLAAIPVDVTKQILQMTAISLLPQGLVTGLPLGMVAPAAHLDTNRDTLKWQYHDFNKPPVEVTYEVPGAPAGDPWGVQWGILDLRFKAKASGTTTLAVQFYTRRNSEETLYDEKFEIGYISAAPFGVDKSSIDVGELTDTSAVQNHEVVIYSSTRTPENFQKPEIRVAMPLGVNGEPGPFVAVGELTPIPESDFIPLMMRLTIGRDYPVRVMSAYRMPITVSPKVGGETLDIGKLIRVVNLVSGNETKQIQVQGSMRGPLKLSGSKELTFGFFNFTDEQNATVTIETDRTGVELEIVNELTQPAFMKLELIKQPDLNDRGFYKLKAKLPGNEQLGDIKDGLVVLKSKGASPLRLRIPVTGRGR